MSKTLIVLATCGACVATLFLCGLAAHNALAQCSDHDQVAWNSSPSSVNADDQTGLFQTTLVFEWDYQQTPTNGGCNYEQVTQPEDHILDGSVDYIPSYFYPTTCNGSVDIDVDGELDQGQSSGSLKTKGWCWPPYREAFKTISIY